jgi:hypothetical protein
MNAPLLSPVRRDARARVSPRVLVRPISIESARDLPSLRAAFAEAEEVALRQDFPGGDPDGPASGSIRMAWSGSELHFLAELKDEHIHTRAKRLNEMVYLLGDCLEIFLKAPETPAYLEFHIAPNNVKLQLLFPSQAEFQRFRHWPESELIARFALPRPAFTSQVWPDAGAQRWTVFASIDLRLLLPAITTLARRELEFHFGRYDYPADGREPVLSCTSALSRLDFHHLEEWGRLVLCADS